jgi:hypothetical protein
MPAERAFIVQFSQASEAGRGWFSGRAEHIMSGQHTSFVNPGELAAFFRRVMNRQFSPSEDKGGSGKPES